MKHLIYFSIFVTILLSSCDKTKEQDTQIILGVLIDSSVDLYYTDSSGNDLLDTLCLNHYNKNEIKLLNFIDGEAIEFHESFIDGSTSNGLYFYKREDINSYAVRIMRLYPSSILNKVVSGNISRYEMISFLQLNENETDTVKCEIEQYEGQGGFSSVITKVWYNNELKWESKPTDSNRIIKITK